VLVNGADAVCCILGGFLKVEDDWDFSCVDSIENDDIHGWSVLFRSSSRTSFETLSSSELSFNASSWVKYISLSASPGAY
jgi:hypothetical protein